MAHKPFIALDWGTTSFRAYQVAADGTVTDERRGAGGILAVADRDFEGALEKSLAGWDTALPVVACGMITSRQGWVELPYVACPAGPQELARAIHRVSLASGRQVHFVTGLHLAGGRLGHDVMRSEETQVFGSLADGARHFVTPGTHSKWITVDGGRIVDFATYVTGELYAAVKDHTILGRLMEGEAEDAAAFADGVGRALADPAGLLHLLFSVRSRGLFQDVPPAALASYLSGLLIGCEVAHASAALPPGTRLVILAGEGIGQRYLAAMQQAGLAAELGHALAMVKGQALVAQAAGVI